MHKADAGLLRVLRVLRIIEFSIDAHFAVVADVDTTQNVHQRGLARAIFSNKAVNFAPLHFKV